MDLADAELLQDSGGRSLDIQWSCLFVKIRFLETALPEN